jgi:hypothetical protein
MAAPPAVFGTKGGALIPHLRPTLALRRTVAIDVAAEEGGGKQRFSLSETALK